MITIGTVTQMRRPVDVEILDQRGKVSLVRALDGYPFCVLGIDVDPDYVTDRAWILTERIRNVHQEREPEDMPLLDVEQMHEYTNATMDALNEMDDEAHGESLMYDALRQGG